MKRILLTTDFSAESKRAFEKALDLARRLHLGIKLAHVVEDVRIPAHGAPLAPPQSDPGLSREIDAAEATMEKFRQEMPRDVDIETIVLSGESVAQTLAGLAGDDVEMIVLSTHGVGGLRRLFVGSVAAEVLAHATVPVLAIPPLASPKE